MARNTSLYVKICEAKNLSIKDVSGSSDPYCVIKIDNQVIARTSTVWRSLNPFWGEEYSLHLPNGFHQMSLYVYDEDRLNRDDFIGRLTLLKEQLRSTTKGISGWFQLRESNKNEEIQGEVHLEISRMTYEDKIYLKVKVIEARELAPKDTRGTSDPFVRVSFLQCTRQTQKIKASRFPKWHESMEFEVPSFTADAQELQISVWDWDRIGGDNFMGQAVFRLGDIKDGKVFNQWFRLLPSEMLCKNDDQKPRGSIRIQARLLEERILPSEYYRQLIQLLNDSVNAEKHDLDGPTPLKMLRDVTTLDLHEMSSTLVRLYLGQGNIVKYLNMVCAEDIETTGNPNTLFRGNSLATKSVDQFMKIVGIPYLLETLGPIIKVIYEENKFVELDPHKLQMMRKLRRPSLKMNLSDDDLIDSGRDILLRYLNLIHENFVNTVTKVPPVMRLVFKNVQKHIIKKWPQEQYKDHKYLGVSGFLFLRFLVPAILGPKLFFLKDQHPSARISRTLTLIAKAMQCVGNLQSGVGKEQYLEPLHPFIKASVKGIRGYIDKLCEIDEAKVHIDLTRRRSVFHPSVVVKQGYLNKKRWCENKQFRSMAYKKRYFWLKYDCISYAKKPTDQVRTTITMHQIIAVEFVDKSAFRKGNLGQIITRNSKGLLEVIYFQAKDVNEAYSWVSSLRKMVLVNSDTLDYFHPGAFRHSKWTCCHQTLKQDDGCSKTHTHAVLGDWRDPLDPDVEAQTIYSQLYLGRHKLRQKYLRSNEEIRKSLLSLHTIDKGSRSSNNDLSRDQRRRHSHTVLHCSSREGSTHKLIVQSHDQRRRHSHSGSRENSVQDFNVFSNDIKRVRMTERRGSYSNPEIRTAGVNSPKRRMLPPSPAVEIKINIHCVDDDDDDQRNNEVNTHNEHSKRIHQSRERLRRNSQPINPKSIAVSKSFNDNNSSNKMLRKEQEMVTLFKAKSQSDFAKTTIPGLEGMIKVNDKFSRRKSASELHSASRLEIRNHMTHRKSVGSIDARPFGGGSGSMLSIPFGKPPSEFEAELSSLAQLLDIVSDLERVHAAYDRMEMERKRDTLHNILDNSFTDLCDETSSDKQH